MTKRVSICMVALLCMALLVPISAQATGTTTYDLDQLGMSIDIPNDYDVFTRDTPADDPAYAWYGFTKKDLDSLLEQQNAYLNALLPDISQEIVVIMVDSPLQNLSPMSNAAISFFASELDNTYEDLGYTFLKYEIYQHEQIKFLKIYVFQENNGLPDYGLQYYTACNGQGISITLHSYTGEITQADEDALQKIVDSAVFQNAEPIPEADISAEPFEYVDAKTGVSFTVPANWREEALFDERETISAKFVSTLEEGVIILYGSVDMWEQMPEMEKSGVSRFEVDNRIFSEVDSAELAKSWGIEGGEVSQVEYGGRTYFMLDGTLGGQVYGQTVLTPATVMLRVENGYLFLFQFMGGSDSPYFQDFTQLLSSVFYPLADLELPPLPTLPPTPPPIPAYRSNPTANPYVSSGAVAFITAFLYWVLIGRKRGTQDPPAQEASSSNDSPQESDPLVSQDSALPDEQVHQTGTPVLGDPPMSTKLEPSESENDNQPKILFCHKCGSRLIFRGTHCFRCGAKIPDETEM